MDIGALLDRGRQELTVEEARRRVRNEDAALLDVRDREEWDAAHAPDAIHIPLTELEQRLDEIARDRRLVAACRSGNRSAAATRLLRAHGYDAANLAGGMKAWQRAGLPLEPSTGEVI